MEKYLLRFDHNGFLLVIMTYLVTTTQKMVHSNFVSLVLTRAFLVRYLECPQYIARMFLVDLYTLLRKAVEYDLCRIYRFFSVEYTCRETFSDLDSGASFESYIINNYPALNETIHLFRKLKIRAEVDLVVCLASFSQRTSHLDMRVLFRFSHLHSMIQRREFDCSISYYKNSQNMLVIHIFVNVKLICRCSLKNLNKK